MCNAFYSDTRSRHTKGSCHSKGRCCGCACMSGMSGTARWLAVAAASGGSSMKFEMQDRERQLGVGRGRAFVQC